MRHPGLDLSLFGSKTGVAAPSLGSSSSSGGSIQQHLPMLLPIGLRHAELTLLLLTQTLSFSPPPALYLPEQCLLLSTHATLQETALPLLSGCLRPQKASRSFPTTSPLPIPSLLPAPQHHKLCLPTYPRSSTGPASCPAQQPSNPVIFVLCEQSDENLAFHPLKWLAQVPKSSLCGPTGTVWVQVHVPLPHVPALSPAPTGAAHPCDAAPCPSIHGQHMPWTTVPQQGRVMCWRASLLSPQQGCDTKHVLALAGFCLICFRHL